MYLKKDVKIKLVNHLTEHLFTMEQNRAKPYRIYDYMTRGGLKKDCLWMNYNPADIALNNYAYLGSDFTERQQIKRQLNNIISKLDKLPFHKRDSILRDLIAHFNYAGQ